MPENSRISLTVENPSGGIVVFDHICKNCAISIGIREIPSDLIGLVMSQFDIILGMDWLKTFSIPL